MEEHVSDDRSSKGQNISEDELIEAIEDPPQRAGSITLVTIYCGRYGTAARTIGILRCCRSVSERYSPCQRAGLRIRHYNRWKQHSRSVIRTRP